MWRLRLALGLCLASIMMMSACSGKPDHSSETDELKRSSELIDQKQYSEAIYVLSDRVKRNPQEVRARVLLASAYAARAGLQLQKFTNFAGELEKWNKIDTLMPAVDYTEPTIFDQIARIAIRIEIVVRAFDAIPVPSSQAAIDDLNQGYQILVDAGPLRGGPSFYRALLHIALFKQNMSTTYRPRYIAGCQILTSDILIWLGLVKADLTGIISDVSNGMNDASAQQTMKQTSQDIENAVAFISRALVIVPVATKIVQGGLGKAQVNSQLNADHEPVPPAIPIPPAFKKVYGPCN